MDTITEPPPIKPNGEFIAEIPIALIIPNPRQPRRHFNQANILELAQSIRSQGVIQPLVVRPHPTQSDHYELVAGERRLRAIKTLGWGNAPVLVRKIADDALLEAALVENLQREQLTPLEEAQSYRTLLDEYGYTQETLSRRVGKDRSTIANMVRLLALPGTLQEDLEENRLSVGHARALLAVDDTHTQLELRNLILAGELSVRETEQLVNRARDKAALPPQAQPLPETPEEEMLRMQYQAVQESLEQHFATKIAINRQGQHGGKVEIEFYSLDDFNRIYELLISR